ncbi:PerC family transcriptional regulator [Salmonella enterica]|nr:PerC family transcriptional regulator [Salmonella enterica]
MVDETAEKLEQRGLWRRAARRWLDVLHSVTDEKLQEAAVLRRNHCQSMARRSYCGYVSEDNA